MAQALEDSTGKLSCPGCSLSLTGYESRCPACGKPLSLPAWLRVVLLTSVAAVACGGILAAGHIKNGKGRPSARPEDAYAAAREFVLKQPGIKVPLQFAPLGDTVVDPLGPGKYRVSGRAEARDASGQSVRLMYSCLVER